MWNVEYAYYISCLRIQETKLYKKGLKRSNNASAILENL